MSYQSTNKLVSYKITKRKLKFKIVYQLSDFRMNYNNRRELRFIMQRDDIHNGR